LIGYGARQRGYGLSACAGNTEPNAIGHFGFSNLPPGTYELQITEPGFKTVSKDFQVNSQVIQPLAITLDVYMGYHCLGESAADPEVSFDEPSKKNLALAGSVRSFRGKALAGATLTLLGQQTQTAVSHPDGSFEFFNVAPGKYTLKTAREGYYDSSVTTFWIARENLTGINMHIVRQKGPLPCN